MKDTKLDAETLATLRLYREAANKALAARPRGKGATWVDILADDWFRSGPVTASGYGFPRREWCYLQVLRNNHGPKICPYLDELIDASVPS